MNFANQGEKLLVAQAIRLLAVGNDVEHKRSIVKRMTELSMEPTMELFRAIDNFNIAKMEFEQLEREHIALRDKIVRQKHSTK